MKKPDFTEQQLLAIRRWLIELQGSLDQGKFAADVLAVTRWSIERSRVSKYVNGTAPLGREVFGHFADYARLTGKSVPDLSATDAPAPDLATALAELTVELGRWRAERQAWERGVLAALAATEGPARAALLASLVPQPLEDARP